jgi:tryptophan-rich sensory protein
MFFKSFAKLIILVLICLATGWLGSLFTRSSIPNWYTELQKPAFNPPNWVFAPVWTVLYIMMAFSAFIVVGKGLDTPAVKIALIAFVIQLILNALWTPVFFGAHLIFLALLEIILLWLAILFTIVTFYKVSISAALLLIPYLLWVTFAAVLNAALWLLNK